jgi:hypothetical protein
MLANFLFFTTGNNLLNLLIFKHLLIYKNNILKGSFKVPCGGFKTFPLKITRIGNNTLLPVAHTCFNTIDLPEY